MTVTELMSARLDYGLLARRLFVTEVMPLDNLPVYDLDHDQVVSVRSEPTWPRSGGIDAFSKWIP